jgi:hypothetical protein
MDGLGGDTGEDGVALCEEGVQGSAEAVIIEAVGRDVPQEIGSGFLSPAGNVDERGGVTQARGQKEGEDAAVGESELRVGRQVSIDNVGDVEALQKWGDKGQMAEGPGFIGDGCILPGEGHMISSEEVLERNGGRREVIPEKQYHRTSTVKP